MQSNSEQIGKLPGHHNQPGGPANTNKRKKMKEKWNQQAIKASREIIMAHATKTDPKTFTDDFIIDLLNQVERFGEIIKKNKPLTEDPSVSYKRAVNFLKRKVKKI